MRTIENATLVAICHCDACGRDSHVEAASVWTYKDAEGTLILSGVFGSAADFCRFCDEPYEGEHLYKIVDKTLDRFDVV